jgi:TRAP-type C4-dicarboxylate transport system permease large subunit
VFQFFLANMGWPQDIADWVNSLGLSSIGFLFVLMGTLLVLSMFLTGVAILVLTVPIFFPVALSLGIDPIHLGILTALAIEIGSVIPPVGLNLFAVSGVTCLPLTQVIEGPFRSAARIRWYSLSCCFSRRLPFGYLPCFRRVIFDNRRSLAIYFFRLS